MLSITPFSSHALKSAPKQVRFGNDSSEDKPVVKVGLNSVGRIGKNVIRQQFADEAPVKSSPTSQALVDKILNCPVDMRIKAVNVGKKMSDQDLIDTFEYDNILGHAKLNLSVKHDGDKRYLTNGNPDKDIRIVGEREINKLPWKEEGVDIVMDTTGVFKTKEGGIDTKTGRKKEGLEDHIKAGASRVILSAPAKDDTKQVVNGINDKEVSPADEIISSASCTTTCVVPIIKLVNDNFKIVSGNIDTVHSATSSQQILDRPIPEGEKNPGKFRGILNNIVPYTTGAANAVVKVMPEMKGKLDADAVRVPVTNGSLAILTLNVEKPTTKEEVMAKLTEASKNPKTKDLIAIGHRAVTSADILGRHESAIIVPDKVKVSKDGKTIKIYAFYDNEYGYTRSLMDTTRKMATQVAEEKTGRTLSAQA